MKVAHTVDVGMRTQEVLLAPDGKTAYVSCDQDGKVAAISLADWKVKKVIDAGKGADGLAWAATLLILKLSYSQRRLSASNSSNVRGQSEPNNRDRPRSASTLPPV